MIVQRIPRHTGIERNEIADKEAKKQAKLRPTPKIKMVQTLSNAKRQSKKGNNSAWQLKWQIDSSSGAIQIYKDLGLMPTTRTKALPKLTMKQEVLRWLIAARLGHGHFVAYHERFKHKEEIDIHCTCGQRRAQLHLFSCHFGRMHRALLQCKNTHRELGPEEVLGSREGVIAFAQRAPATGLFKRRYRNAGEEEQGTLE